MSDVKARRDEIVDIAKGIAIFLVILGHVVTEETYTKTLVYSFHMPFFFVLSGLTISADICERRTLKNFLENKIYTLIVPYFVFALIYSKFSLRNILYIGYGSREMLIRASSLTSLWFIPVMFIVQLLVYFSFWLKKKDFFFARYCLILFAVISFFIGVLVPRIERYGFIWGINIALVAFAFTVIGYLFRPLFIKIKEGKIICSLLLFILSTFLLLMITPYGLSDRGYMLMGNAIYGNAILLLIKGIVGSFSCILFAIILGRIKLMNAFFSGVGKKTLAILLIHKPFINPLISINRFDVDINSPFVAIILALVVLLISLVIIRIIERFAPWLFGNYTVIYK